MLEADQAPAAIAEAFPAYGTMEKKRTQAYSLPLPFLLHVQDHLEGYLEDAGDFIGIELLQAQKGSDGLLEALGFTLAFGLFAMDIHDVVDDMILPLHAELDEMLKEIVHELDLF
jgi:hypothetical protein